MKSWTSRDTHYLVAMVFLFGCLVIAYLIPHMRKESARQPVEESFLGQDREMGLPDDAGLIPLGEGVWMQEEVLLESEPLRIEETPPKVFTNEPGITPEEIAANLGLRVEDLPPRFQKDAKK